MMTISPAKKSWQMIRIALPAPSVDRSPYMPDTTYATASPIVMRIPKSCFRIVLFSESQSEFEHESGSVRFDFSGRRAEPAESEKKYARNEKQEGIKQKKSHAGNVSSRFSQYDKSQCQKSVFGYTTGTVRYILLPSGTEPALLSEF